MQNVVPFPAPVRRRREPEGGLLVGCAYPAQTFAHLADHYPEALVGDYRVGPAAGLYEPAAAHHGELYVYDADAITTPDMLANQLQWLSGYTDGPEVQQRALENSLHMSMQFAVQFTTHAVDAQLGVVHLVSSQRHLQLQDGETITLLETEEPVLYLDHHNHQQGVECIDACQPLHREQAYHYTLQLHQAIPDTFDSRPLETLTVLEQYQSYFLQRPCLEGRDTIWTPLLAPVSWGWSIRVGRRADGQWTIVRRKLVLPGVGHDGLQLPLWQTNTRLLALNGGR